MNRNTTLILRIAAMLFVCGLPGILTQNAKAQSVYMMKLLPHIPSALPKVEAPEGTKRLVQLKDDIWYDKVTTDTVSIETYDARGRVEETILFSSSGKRGSHFFHEYPDEYTKKFYTIKKVDSKLSTRNYDEAVRDAAGNLVDASMYQVTNEGDTIMVNDHDYVYDDSLRLVYQCDMCNQEYPTKRYFHYKGYNLIRLRETRADPSAIFDINDMTYDQDGRMTRYTYLSIFKGDTTLRADCMYTYENGQMVHEMRYNDFEKGWSEFIYRYDAQGNISQSYEIIETDTTATTYYYEGDKRVRSFLHTTFHYSDGGVLFGRKFRESIDGKDHTTEIKYTYDRKGHRIASEQYWDGELRRRYRTVFE